MAALEQQAWLLPIRQAAADDIEEIYSLNMAAFPEAWSRQALAEAMERGLEYWVWTTPSGRLVAYYLGQDILDEVHILQLAVAKPHRRLGLGTGLTRFVLQHKRRQGMRRAFLEVRSSNRAAQQLYTRVGFRPIGRRKSYYHKRGETGEQEDAILMACAL